MRILALLLLLPTMLFAKPSVHLTVSPNVCTIGDSFVYRIDVRINKDDKLVEVPDRIDFAENSSLEFVRLDSTSTIYEVKKSLQGNSRHIQLNYPIRIYDIGEQLIPTQHISLLLKGDNVATQVKLPATTITVQSVRHQSDVAVKRPIVFYFETLDTLSKVLIGLTILAVLMAALVAWRWIENKRRQGEPEPEIVDTRTPLQKAEEAFDLLIKEQLYKGETMKDHYVRLTEIVKRYLQERLSLQLLELTSEETLQCLAGHLSSDDIKRLQHILSFSDVIKYAKEEPGEKDHLAMLETARDFVRSAR